MNQIEFSEAGLKTGIGFKVLNCEMILPTHNWIIDNKSRILPVRRYCFYALGYSGFD